MGGVGGGGPVSADQSSIATAAWIKRGPELEAKTTQHSDNGSKKMPMPSIQSIKRLSLLTHNCPMERMAPMASTDLHKFEGSNQSSCLVA